MGKDILDNLFRRAAHLSGVHMETIEWQAGFMDLAARFAHLPGTVVLLSGGELDCARYHMMGAFPWLTLSGRNHHTQLTVDGRAESVDAPPLDVLRAVLDQYHLTADQWSSPFASGLMGYLAYDLKDGLERLPKTSVDDLHLPHMLLYAHSIVVVHDKKEEITRLLVPLRATVSPDHHGWISRFHEIAAGPIPPMAPYRTDAELLQSNFTREAYQKAVRRVIDYIAAGDVYQVNLSQRFRVPFHGDGFGLFRDLYAQNPAPFFAYVHAGDHQVVSTSPERFLLREGASVETRPIKGTRPRGENAEEDQAMREALARSKKDDAELSMIVDLLRNDIGKVCAAGSVKVTRHKRLEAYQNVYHLVSVITGKLDEGNDSVDLIEAAFPGGSITGCPKVRAMEIIDELESCRRHVYCGSIGYISFHDTLNLSIAIRTATIVNDTLSFSVGGGIVIDSDPLLEYEETLHKGRTLSAACSRGQGVDRPAPKVWFNGRLMSDREATVPVHDQGLLYGYGFFETIRVDRGRAPLLEDHLRRFEQTWKALMPIPFPEISWADIVSRVVDANRYQDRCAAVKIVATRGSRNQPPWDYTLLATARPYIHRLKQINQDAIRLGVYKHARQTPLASHKTLNYLYYLRAGQWALQNGYHEALILNPDGSVSETNTANLLLVDANEVVRPQSTAVLPGVMAEAMSRTLAAMGYTVIERPVGVDELHSAEILLAANALMGAVPVSHVGGQSRRTGSDLWIRLNDTVIPGWRESSL